MYDILSNNRFGRIRSVAVEAFGDAAANAPTNDGVDLWADNQLPNRVLLLIDVSAVASNGTLDLIVQDSPNKSTWDDDFITIPQITAAGVYLVEIDDPERYVRINHDAKVANVTWGAYFVTYENQRGPVKQTGTVLKGVYGAGRKAKVAS
jgi:hypothetical protein